MDNVRKQKFLLAQEALPTCESSVPRFLKNVIFVI